MLGKPFYHRSTASTTMVKVTRKFQVTIPEEVRRSVGVEIGDELLVRKDGRRIVMEKRIDIENLAGAWKHIRDTEEFMREVRKLWRKWKLK